MPATPAVVKCILTISVALIFITSTAARAGDQAAPAPTASGSALAASTANTRYGLFDALDTRSSYGDSVFPEPFIVDDTVLEVNEARLDWLHTAGEGNQHSDEVSAEVEKGFGQST